MGLLVGTTPVLDLFAGVETLTDYVARYRPIVAGTAEIDDNFNRADTTELGTGWTPRAGWNPLSIVSNRAVPSAAGPTCVEDSTIALSSDDMWAEMTVRLGGATFIGLLVRGIGGARAEVGAEINAEFRYELVEFIDGTHVTRAVTGPGTVPTGTDLTLRIECLGAQARYYVNGVLTLSATLTTRLTGRRVSFGATDQGGSVTTQFDNVRAGPLTGGTWTDFAGSVSTAPNMVVTGLTGGTPYEFQVAGVSSFGTGDYSSGVVATPT